MDSVRPHPPSVAAAPPDAEALASTEVVDPARGALPLVAAAPSRLARLEPAARRAVRVAWKTAMAGALGAAAVWAALFGRGLLEGDVLWGLALVVGAVLLAPPAAAAVLAWTLGDLVALPGTLRDAARHVAPRAGEPTGLFQTVWALRGLAAEGAGAWAAAAGLVRLASLPFVLGLLVLVALNAVNVAAGIVALVWLAI